MILLPTWVGVFLVYLYDRAIPLGAVAMLLFLFVCLTVLNWVRPDEKG
ncbi:hypothetical protein LX87_04087 [Larkinella arboricola]|uniref:Uncharacterized protein n=1 Tax=Larkinella arboricola TaxID=643671 RepID=A0A327WS96_LARAB|nr:hypothetical protein [Larkinella arboricola]RAJ94202.1 hypothetical protein LX87_04087 [Larkinella arboricola]